MRGTQDPVPKGYMGSNPIPCTIARIINLNVNKLNNVLFSRFHGGGTMVCLWNDFFEIRLFDWNVSRSTANCFDSVSVDEILGTAQVLDYVFLLYFEPLCCMAFLCVWLLNSFMKCDRDNCFIWKRFE